jgi:hypothetical protein
MQSDVELCMSTCTFDACMGIKLSVNNYFFVHEYKDSGNFDSSTEKMVVFCEVCLNQHRMFSCISNSSMITSFKDCVQ